MVWCSFGGACDFYPRSPCGERQQHQQRYLQPSRFLSTLSLRRATRKPSMIMLRAKISIHALLAESDHTNKTNGGTHHISIHALLAESDAVDISVKREASISIHALLAESDYITIITICIVLRFLSTLSLRRATACFVIAGTASAFLSTLSLRRATEQSASYNAYLAISIHALLAESD